MQNAMVNIPNGAICSKLQPNTPEPIFGTPDLGVGSGWPRSLFCRRHASQIGRLGSFEALFYLFGPFWDWTETRVSRKEAVGVSVTTGCYSCCTHN